MTNSSPKKLSRREALKILGAAAGAAALANLPAKWSKPELVSGVLPAHAQTSPALLSYFIACSGDPTSGQTGIVENLQAVITANQPVSLENIAVQITVELTNPAGPSSVHDTQVSDAAGLVIFGDLFCPFQDIQDFNLIFSFVDQATYGTNTCTLGEYTFNGC